MAISTVYSSDKNAVWLQRSCIAPWEFLGCYDVSDLTIPRGEISSSRKRTGKGVFRVVSTRRNTPDNPSVTFTFFRETVNLLTDLPCAPNVLILYSSCGSDEDPTNYDFFDLLEGVEITETSQAGVVNAIAPDDATDVGVDVVIEASAEMSTVYTIKSLVSTDLSLSSLSNRIIDDIAVCDPLAQCGECTAETIGCQTLWIITRGSPGVYGDARIFKSVDGGTTWVEQTNSMTSDSDNLSAIDCDEGTVVITNGDTAEYQYTNDGGATWSLVTTPVQVLNDVFVLSSVKIWFAADAGYIYFSSDKGASVTAQESGGTTVQNLNSIHFADSELGYTVGDSNTFLRTTNGGTNWAAVTGPSIGNNLNVVRAVSNSNILYVGDAAGSIFRSADKGDTWVTVMSGFSQMVGGITDIQACECPVILVSGLDVNGLGSVYQSVDGGNTWTKQTTPADAADSVLALACCDVNTYFGVGDNGLVFKLAGESYRDSDPR